jgi:hypothetical protein
MPFDSELSAKCSALRISSRKLAEACCALQTDAWSSETESATVNAAPSSLRMSMGVARKESPITLCSFARSELMVKYAFIVYRYVGAVFRSRLN